MANETKAPETPAADSLAPTPEEQVAALQDVLTPEEQVAALQEAWEYKARRVTDAAAAKAAEEAAAKEAAEVQKRADNPQEFAGLEDSQGNVRYVKFPARRERTVLVEGATYEHIRDDAQGVWVYRKA